MLSFSEWLKEATKRNKTNLYSVSVALGVAHSTLYSKMKADSFTDKDIQEISNILGDYGYIDALKEELETHISKIESGVSL